MRVSELKGELNERDYTYGEQNEFAKVIRRGVVIAGKCLVVYATAPNGQSRRVGPKESILAHSIDFFRRFLAPPRIGAASTMQ